MRGAGPVCRRLRAPYVLTSAVFKAFLRPFPALLAPCSSPLFFLGAILPPMDIKLLERGTGAGGDDMVAPIDPTVLKSIKADGLLREGHFAFRSGRHAQWLLDRDRLLSDPTFTGGEQVEQLLAAAVLDTHPDRNRALDRILDEITATAPVV